MAQTVYLRALEPPPLILSTEPPTFADKTCTLWGIMEAITTLWYLGNLPLYKTTKPYVINLPALQIPGGQRTNQQCIAYPGIKVKDMRTSGQTFTLDQNGFELSSCIPISLTYDEFRDSKKVREVYCEKVKEALLRMTGAEFGKVLHAAVCRSLFRGRHDADDLRDTRFAVDTLAFLSGPEEVQMPRRISLYKAFIVVRCVPF